MSPFLPLPGKPLGFACEIAGLSLASKLLDRISQEYYQLAAFEAVLPTLQGFIYLLIRWQFFRMRIRKCFIQRWIIMG